MKKIPTIFERDWDGDRSRVIDKPNPAAAWVFAGEGVATRKLDGACCLIRGGKFYKRREIKKGQTPPPEFELADHDDETGKTVGWVPVTDAPEDKWFREALANTPYTDDGTYEAVGPHHQGGAELTDLGQKLVMDQLWPHSGARAFVEAPRTFDGLRNWLAGKNIEGLVWHHPDGRMAKIKLRDFGLKRLPSGEP